MDKDGEAQALAGAGEKARGLEARLRKAAENGRLSHRANAETWHLRELLRAATTWRALGNGEKSAERLRELEGRMEKAAAFLKEEGF